MSFSVSGPPRTLHSFPTRRSSDLDPLGNFLQKLRTQLIHKNQVILVETLRTTNLLKNRRLARAISDAGFGEFVGMRSEEHTSELQSRRDLVCRLLLEKKNRPEVIT